MDIQSRKIAFISEFLQIQNEDLLATLENLLYQRKAEAYERDLKPMSSNRFNHEIDQALDDSANDRVIKASDLKAKAGKWRRALAEGAVEFAEAAEN